MKKLPRFLARASKLPSGYATGGGDTPFGHQPQRADYTVPLTDSNYADFVLPKGTLIIAYVVIPDSPSLPEDTREAVTGGTLIIDTVDSSGTVIAHKLTSTSASAYSRTAVSGGLILTAETRFRATASSILPAATGVVRVGVEAIMPKIRS